MRNSERGWIRGAVVIGLAGAMMAVALLSPALAVRLATTGYVKQRVNAVGNIALSGLRNPSYGQSPVFSLPANNSITMEGSCVGRSVVGGGASAGGGAAGAINIIESYPSDGNITTPNVAGRNGWSVTVGNYGATAVNVYEYLICADTTAASGITGSTARSTSSSPKWSSSTAPLA